MKATKKENSASRIAQLYPLILSLSVSVSTVTKKEIAKRKE